jgi:tetratricopeptide (TPR) repeat protein
VKPVFAVALIVICCLAARPPRLYAQAPAGGNSKANSPSQNSSNQNRPAGNSPAPAQSNVNAFPEDESSVPVLPSKSTPDAGPGSFDGSVNGRAVLPAGDVDPVQSPDGSSDAAGGANQSYSSSLSGMDSLVPGPDTEQPGKHGRNQDDLAPEHHETAKEDESVGKYYLDSKDWRAAQSRYQSAMVLDPDNPDVYWGLAESARHLGDYAAARTYYLKVMEYDPGSRHAKDAKKTLEEPELANAKPAAAPSGGKTPQ